ncbi:hypothetical protein MEX01_54610 [Methylorubrum extorquens]|uniref:hypothetical protein n=1 Tax=Methylorubrum extorquens TaxID=408 RepID=UPI00116E9853|nr:hypothetical protein [Methylorubrum extorquens]GEL44870.1 hypothetical protein MEX01_54610 [Methylorubrum extorquens]
MRKGHLVLTAAAMLSLGSMAASVTPAEAGWRGGYGGYHGGFGGYRSVGFRRGYGGYGYRGGFGGYRNVGFRRGYGGYGYRGYGYRRGIGPGAAIGLGIAGLAAGAIAANSYGYGGYGYSRPVGYYGGYGYAPAYGYAPVYGGYGYGW